MAVDNTVLECIAAVSKLRFDESHDLITII